MPKKVSVQGPQLETLRNLRMDQGFSQAKFARFVGIHPSPYNRVERGWVEPTREQKIKIAKALHVDSRTIWP